MLQPPDDRRRPPGADANARSLSPHLRHLFHRIWRMGYGTIRGVHFRDGDPLSDPPFHPVRKARLSEEAWPRRESATADFALKREHLRFIEELAAAGTGVVDIKVVNGLPVDLEIHEQP
jgi:hypothetical protein